MAETYLRFHPADTIVLDLGAPGEVHGIISIKNTSSTTVAYKVRLTQSKSYTLGRSHGVLKPGASADARIGLNPNISRELAANPAQASMDRILIQAIPCERALADLDPESEAFKDGVSDLWRSVVSSDPRLQQTKFTIGLKAPEPGRSNAAPAAPGLVAPGTDRSPKPEPQVQHKRHEFVVGPTAAGANDAATALTQQQVRSLYGSSLDFQLQSPSEAAEALRARIKSSCEDFEQINILFAGPRGAGKSSLINSLVSAFQGSITHVNATGASMEQCTRDLNSTEIITSGADKERKIVLWDSPGLEEYGASAFYSKGQFLSIVRGRFYDGQQDVSTVDVEQAGLRLRRNPGLDNRMHVVIFCVPARWVKGSDSDTDFNIKKEAIERMMADVKIAQEDRLGRSLQSFLVLTQADKVNEQVLYEPELLLNSDTFHAVRREAAYVFRAGIQENKVLAMHSYTAQFTTNPKTDALLLFLLNRAVDQAQDHIVSVRKTMHHYVYDSLLVTIPLLFWGLAFLLDAAIVILAKLIKLFPEPQQQQQQQQQQPQPQREKETPALKRALQARQATIPFIRSALEKLLDAFKFARAAIPCKETVHSIIERAVPIVRSAMKRLNAAYDTGMAMLGKLFALMKATLDNWFATIGLSEFEMDIPILILITSWSVVLVAFLLAALSKALTAGH